jgi:2-oxoisovalerate dehydrogenase E1 component
MTSDRRDPLEIAWAEAVTALDLGNERTDLGGLTDAQILDLLDTQLESRHVDLAARWLRAQGHGFYTIGSAGHESNAAVAMALRSTDPALLHYRSGGFYCARARQASDIDPVTDILQGMFASVDEPIAGGRHKVFGRHELAIIPQTSTIASHLPRAVGVAFTIGRAPKLPVPIDWPGDALAVCSFGDASANHSTAVGAINTACHCAHSRLPLPLLFVCEDNGIGISVRTPGGWIEAAYGNRTGLRYATVDGTDPAAVFATTSELAAWVRSERRPAFLHLTTVRFLGHAGSDVEAGYRTPDEIRRDYARDPIVGTARLVVGAGLAQPDEVIARSDAIRDRVRERALAMVGAPQLQDAATVMVPLSPRSPDRVADAAAHCAPADQRAAWFGTTLPENEGALTLAQSINRALADLLLTEPRTVMFGEDVAVKGGVYGVTRGLAAKAGVARVFDTLLDEQAILGLALGSGVSGLVPIPEIQYLAYLHNAEDQLRGEAASLSFFSQGQYRNGMVIRVQGYGYQKGFGGHFHNDNAVAVLRDIPGIVIASPARGADAAAMLRTCVAAAAIDGTVCVFLEPIALYATADLHEPGDGGWLDAYSPPSRWAATHVPIGAPHVSGHGGDLLLVSWANGLHMSQRVAHQLAADGIGCRVLDLRWLAPLPMDVIVRHATEVGRVLVVDETRASGGVGEGIVSALVDAGFGGRIRRVASQDSFIPLGDAARHVMLDEHAIADAARKLMR